MTREEARKIIIAFTIAYAEEGWPVEIGESLGMAISALSENKGKWIDNGSLSCRCNQCGCKNNRETAFCPNCGADMRGE